MAAESFQFRVSWHKLLMGLCLTLVPLALGGLLIVARTEQQMAEMLGRQFQTLAGITASEVTRYIDARVMSVNTLAADPAVLDVVVAANAAWKGSTEPQIEAKVQATEKSWNTPAGQPLVSAMLDNKASRMLRRYRDLDRRFLRITLTDRVGAVVAATHKTQDYYQADEDFWRSIYADGRGAIGITDVLYDEVSNSYYVGVGVPVVAEGTNEWIGALDALVDVSTVFPLLYQSHDGNTARTMLVRADGTVIAGTKTTLAMKVKAEEVTALAGYANRPESGFFVADVRGNRTLIAFANTGLEQRFKNLAWTVIVAQDVSEAYGPIHRVMRWIAFLAFAALAMVTLAVMWFTVHRRREFTEITQPDSSEKPVPHTI